MPTPSELCRGYLLGLLNKKDYSYRILYEKAIVKDFEIEIVEQVLQDFVDKKWVNDLRFARNIIEFYGGQKGIIWIKQKLQLKKIDSETITQALQETEQISPKQNIKELVARKYSITDWKNLDQKQYAKIYYFLSSRGFTGVQNIITQWKTN
jgi:regulatory protein